MPTLQVDSLLFDFAAQVAAQKYDDWHHYKIVWRNAPGGNKAMDVVAVDPTATATTWLIEAKDFRLSAATSPPKPSNIAGLPQYVADKVADTLTGLADAALNANDATERSHSVIALAAKTRRVVLHLEPHTGSHSYLFPAGFSANVLQKLKQLVQAIDQNPLVLSIASTPSANVPWTVA